MVNHWMNYSGYTLYSIFVLIYVRFVSQVVVRLSHPASMELVLRKRICINVYKRQSLTDKLKKRIGKSVSCTLL